MAATNHPARPAYNAALARLTKAATQLEAAQALGSMERWQADQEFQEALAEYTQARARLADEPTRSYDGVPVPLIWLGPPMTIAGRPVEVDGETGPEAG